MVSSSLPRLILTGPESSGKTILAQALVETLDGILAPEYLRDYFEVRGELTLEDAIPIAQGQWANEERAGDIAQAEDKLLICDTDLISSLVYSCHYYEDELNTPLWAQWEQWAESHKKRLKSPPFAPRLYVLCGTDCPWVPDGQRDAPENREHFLRLFECELKAQGCDYITVWGSVEERLSAVLFHLVQNHLKRG
ncbi:Nicotinamide riboside kinase [Cohaesibacter sp. ES.047]|uniref:AAA family ATPase n=1 Tax=Cohaesibacter sp. ES.047 TaxID=1798205 RepID=UPI000BB8465A|nr:ATP-binding protein [Cohaesibacter sp. ES.047]SNY92104.1 Nicotinamide riboside kinase [Cohaesibacter sp. ES.047]